MNKFSIGEKVQLVSKHFPEHNGVYIISGVTFDETYSYDGSSGYKYKLPTRTHLGDYWCESALRKLPKPSDMTFNELMSSLKTPTKV